MLRDEDRIFRNLYGLDDWRLAGARRRGNWDNTKDLLARGREAIIDEIMPGFAGRRTESENAVQSEHTLA